MNMDIYVLFLIVGTWLTYFSVESVTSPHSLQDHLIPPHKVPAIYQKTPEDLSFAQKLARWFWSPDDEDNNRDVKLKVNGGKHSPNKQFYPQQKPQQSQNHQQIVKPEAVQKGSSTNLMALWVAPSTQNKYTRQTGSRSEDNCNPCSKFPWVPVPRALPAVPAILHSHGDQFSLTIPAISLQYNAPASLPKPVYGVPSNHSSPVSDYHPPPPPAPLPSHQPQYGPPPPKPTPSQTYGIPSDLGKIPLSYANSPLSYPPNVQYSAPSSLVPQKVHPVLVHTPIPFPSMSQGPLPPLFQYEQFSSESALSSYLQPPAPSSIRGHTHGEEECRKCSTGENSHEDSVAAQAQNQETGAHISGAHLTNNPVGVEVMKSVPLAEYLSSVEYPMQIVQAPIVDVADLSKYINVRIPGQKSPSFLQHSGHALFVNHALKIEPSSTPAPDNVLSASSVENKFPESFRPQSTKTQSPTISSTTLEPIQSSTVYRSSLPSSQFTTINLSHTTTTLKPLRYSTITELMPPLPDPPQTFYRQFNTSSLEQQSNTLIKAAAPPPPPPPPSSMRYLNPPHVKATAAPIDWSQSTQPQFSHSSTNQPRFPTQRPNTVSTSSKKTKQVHQIIVPYTTKQIKHNEPGWTPVPPQARKVPQETNGGNVAQHNNNVNYSGTELHLGESIPLSSTASEQFENFKLPGPAEGVTPELVSQLLNFEEGNSQNSIRTVVHPGDVHHVLAANLRALLRGEEDNVDFQRLQKNIDNWTAEGYKTNSPPENFHTLTTLSHLSPSKNIPEEYLTTPSTFLGNEEETSNFKTHNNDNITETGDYEPSGSQNHPVRTSSQVHIKAPADQESEEYESWSLLDTKIRIVTPSPPNSIKNKTNFNTTLDVPTTPSTTTTSTKPSTSSEPTSKAWEQLQVSISPLTKEKVYVVTPQPITSDATTPLSNFDNIPTSVTSTRVDRSYSVETGKRTTRFLRDSTTTQKEPRFREVTPKTDYALKSLGSKVSRVQATTSKTLLDSTENIDPVDENSRFGIKLVPDGKSNRLRRYQDNKGYFRFFPELLKASDYLEDGGDIDQIRRVALELKKENSS